MTAPFATWRLILSPPARGPWNMGVDEAIMETVGKQRVPPTLRLFAWEPPCLSLGYAQPASDVDRNKLSSLGWDIVRRPTGGRAILHTDELTYSVVGPLDEPSLSGSVLESYQRISQALLMALEKLGVHASAEANPAPPQNRDPGGPVPPGLVPPGPVPPGPVCFEVPSSYEITVAGKKIIGSAQSRKQGVLLQHGSLPLCGDLTRITRTLVFQDDEERLRAGERLSRRAATIEEVLGRIVSWDTVANTFIQAFEKSLNIRLEQSGLTPEESTRAGQLTEAKYGHEDWTART